MGLFSEKRIERDIAKLKKQQEKIDNIVFAIKECIPKKQENPIIII